MELAEKDWRDLRARVARMEEAAVLSVVNLHIETFAPEPYRLLKPIPVVVQQYSEDFRASFMDAGINTSGDTQQEAYMNVKELILDVFDSLRALPGSRLGPKPARQLAVLREFLDAAEDHERACRQDREKAEGQGDKVAQGS
ncbi:MAG: hypothetical protein JF614_24880 [Acidobacteria bacterium]|jgi:hypothetical protein|nr:hypothetical protein [Acidobacteriota bacterium]